MSAIATHGEWTIYATLPRGYFAGQRGLSTGTYPTLSELVEALRSGTWRYV